MSTQSTGLDRAIGGALVDEPAAYEEMRLARKSPSQAAIFRRTRSECLLLGRRNILHHPMLTHDRPLLLGPKRQRTQIVAGLVLDPPTHRAAAADPHQMIQAQPSVAPLQPSHSWITVVVRVSMCPCYRPHWRFLLQKAAEGSDPGHEAALEALGIQRGEQVAQVWRCRRRPRHRTGSPVGTAARLHWADR
jgi:hypothetical protein